jgi:hypothetical protein
MSAVAEAQSIVEDVIAEVSARTRVIWDSAHDLSAREPPYRGRGDREAPGCPYRETRPVSCSWGASDVR